MRKLMDVMLLGIVLFAAHGAWAQLQQQQQSPQVPAQQKPYGPAKSQGGSKEHADTAHNPAAALPAAPAKDQQVKASRSSTEGAEQISEYWTILGHRAKITDTLLAVFTFFLILVGIWQGINLRNSVRVSKDALIVLERPFLFLNLDDSVFLNMIMTVGGSVGVNFPQSKCFLNYKVINRGRTPALLIEQRHNFVVTNPGEMPTPIDRRVATVNKLPVGIDCSFENSAKFSIDVLDAVGIKEIGLVLKKQKSLFLIGFIRYQDIFHQGHVTGFCAKFDLVQRANRFVLEGDERYNYTKDE